MYNHKYFYMSRNWSLLFIPWKTGKYAPTARYFHPQPPLGSILYLNENSATSTWPCHSVSSAHAFFHNKEKDCLAIQAGGGGKPSAGINSKQWEKLPDTLFAKLSIFLHGTSRATVSVWSPLLCACSVFFYAIVQIYFISVLLSMNTQIWNKYSFSSGSKYCHRFLTWTAKQHFRFFLVIPVAKEKLNASIPLTQPPLLNEASGKHPRAQTGVHLLGFCLQLQAPFSQTLSSAALGCQCSFSPHSWLSAPSWFCFYGISSFPSHAHLLKMILKENLCLRLVTSLCFLMKTPLFQLPFVLRG